MLCYALNKAADMEINVDVIVQTVTFSVIIYLLELVIFSNFRREVL